MVGAAGGDDAANEAAAPAGSGRKRASGLAQDLPVNNTTWRGSRALCRASRMSMKEMHVFPLPASWARGAGNRMLLRCALHARALRPGVRLHARIALDDRRNGHGCRDQRRTQIAAQDGWSCTRKPQLTRGQERHDVSMARPLEYFQLVLAGHFIGVISPRHACCRPWKPQNIAEPCWRGPGTRKLTIHPRCNSFFFFFPMRIQRDDG